MKNYKIIRKNQFACSTMQVRRDRKMPIAILKDFDEAIISQAYPVFKVIDEKVLNPDYLMMWFTRQEFDRQVTFHAVGGVRGSIEWVDFLDFELPIPSIEKQREIVAEYQAVENKIKTNEQICEKLEAAAQALYKHWFIDFEFPNSPPLEGCPKDGVVNPPLEETTTPKEKEGMLNSPPPEGCPKDGVVSESPKNSIIPPPTKDRVIARNTKNYMSLPYNPKLKDRARKLRKAGHLAEVLFWKQVRNKQFLGLDFDRQKIIGNYIVDFYNANYQLVIEIDGSSHDDKEEYDAKRQAYLEGLGLTVVRFTDVEVKKQIDAVMRYLEDYVEKLEMKNLERNEGMLMKEKNRPERSETVGKEGKNHPAFQAPLQRRGIIGYKSSGGAMVYNEELEKDIPEGWEVKELNFLLDIKYGKSYKHLNQGKIPLYGSGGIMSYVDDYLYDKPSVLIPRKGTLTNIIYIDEPFWSVDTMFYSILKNKHFGFYTFWYLKNLDFIALNVGSAVPSMTTRLLNSMDITLPNISILKSFSKKLDAFHKLKKNRHQANNNLRLLQEIILSRMVKNEI